MRAALLAMLFILPSAGAQVVASLDGNVLELDVDAGVAGAQVVVTHEDPIDGVVVDRIVKVDNGSVHLRLSGLPVNASLKVHLLPLDTIVPRVNATRVLEGALADLAPISSLIAPAIPALGADGVHKVHGYPVTDDAFTMAPNRIVPLDDGRLAYLWRAVDRPEDQVVHLRMALSDDGGRTWSDNMTLLSDVDGGARSFDTVADGAGLWVAAQGPGGLRVAHWANGTATAMSLPADGSGSPRIVRTPAGALLATHSRTWTTDVEPSVTLRDIRQGSVGEARVLPTPDAFSPQGIHMAAGPGRVLIAYAAGDPQVLHYRWSIDGHSWTPVEAIGFDGEPIVESVIVDATGAGHLAVTAWHDDPRDCGGPRPESHHVLLEPSGAHITPMGALVPGLRNSQEMLLAASGPRLWAFVRDVEWFPLTAAGECHGQGREWAVESMDLGRTWGPAYLLERTTAGPLQPNSVAVLSDGVPAFATGFFYAPGDARLSFSPMFDLLATGSLTEVLAASAPADGDRGGGGSGDGFLPDPTSTPPPSSTPTEPVDAAALPVWALLVALAWVARRR